VLICKSKALASHYARGSRKISSAVLNLWRDQVGLVKPGDLIKVENAFAKEFRGRVELNVGGSGRIAVLKCGEGQSSKERKTNNDERPEG